MKIAVASGKGGTGKTTFSLALAEVYQAVLADCDVEEPNCHLFTSAEIEKQIFVELPRPEFIADNCTGCGKCVQVCRFHALAKLGKRILVFPELCHGCKGCILACPEQALQETGHRIGKIEIIQDKHFKLYSGVMDVGHAMAPPLIRELKRVAAAEEEETEQNIVFDAPPGTACPMVTTVRDCDYVILVTEPTPFGLHDLDLAYRTLKSMNIPCGVVLNRAGENDALIEQFCREESMPLHLKIPFSREIACACSRGKTLLSVMPELKNDICKMLKNMGAVS